MINSWGRFLPSGIFIGRFTDLGNYDQCINIQINDSSSGQYCLIDFKPKTAPFRFEQNRFKRIDKSIINRSNYNLFNSSCADYISENSYFTHFQHLKIGICVPSDCNQNQIKSIVKSGM